MARCSTPPKENHLGFLLKCFLLFGTVNVSQVKGQSTFLAAAAFDSNTCRNVYVTYFGDTQNTSAIGADKALPQCYGSFAGQSNLAVRLENTNTGQVLQQVGPFRSINGLLWNTTAIAALTPSLTGSYVCRLYQNSILVRTSGDSYQLNVVVPMNITCQHSPNLKYESLNVLSCTVTGYPLPRVTWTQVNGATISPPQTSLNVSIHQITSTMSFSGNQTGLAAGSFVTIVTTAQYPPFSCTPLQQPTIQMNLCDSTLTNVTMSSGPLQIVARCPTFYNASFSPSTPPSTEYATQFSIACAPGHTGSSTNSSLRCLAFGTWTTFPTCIEIDECTSTPCKNNGMCLNHVDGFSCLCQPGYTGRTCDTYDACLLMPCHDTSSACRDTGNRKFACDCPVGTTGDGEMEGGCMTVRRTTATTQYRSTEPSASPSSNSSATATTSTNLPIQPITSANTSTSATASTTSPATLDTITSANTSTSVTASTTPPATLENGLLQVWIIPSAVSVGVLLLLLIVLFIGCYLKRRSSPSPRKPTVQAPQKTPQADLTMNAGYEDATTLSNAMTESSAYELAGVPNQPNYDFIQPTQPIQYNYVTPR